MVVDLTFHCENDQKLKDSHPTSHCGLYFSNGFPFYVAFWLHRGGSRLLRSELVAKWWRSDHPAISQSWKSASWRPPRRDSMSMSHSRSCRVDIKK